MGLLLARGDDYGLSLYLPKGVIYLFLIVSRALLDFVGYVYTAIPGVTPDQVDGPVLALPLLAW